MPDPPFDAKQESLKFVGAASFEGDPIVFGPTKTRPLPGGGSPVRYASDSDDSGKAVVVEGDTGKEPMNVASSSSSSMVAETEEICNNLASGSSSQHDEAADPTDVPEALPIYMSMRSITPMNESKDRLYWRNQAPRLYEDTPEQANISSGLANYESLMQLPEEPEHDADIDPHQFQDPEELLMLPTPIVTFLVPGFSMGLAGGIVPFAEVQSVEDPDDVGLENLDVFMNP